MDLSFRPLTLDALDEAKAEALCLFVGEEERPLTGLAGLVDWRLSGRLSRMIRSGLLTGAAGEAILAPPGSRLSFEKLFLFGTGTSRDAEALSSRLIDAMHRLFQAGVREAALQLPPGVVVDEGARRLLAEEQAPQRGLVFAPDRSVVAEALAQSGAARPPDRRVVKVPPPGMPDAAVSPERSG
ncbi:MAG TPA: M17 family peptidase N-terminal domain-containing protein, partial [Myxococcales bacterium]|nr:M17 family peptidase N-terminal domain-containing protein [Myxococcales bacterium]